MSQKILYHIFTPKLYRILRMLYIKVMVKGRRRISRIQKVAKIKEENFSSDFHFIWDIGK